MAERYAASLGQSIPFQLSNSQVEVSAENVSIYSKRMRVPDRLLLIDDGHNGYAEQPSRKETSSAQDLHRMMVVPDRILVIFIDQRIFPHCCFGSPSFGRHEKAPLIIFMNNVQHSWKQTRPNLIAPKVLSIIT